MEMACADRLDCDQSGTENLTRPISQDCNSLRIIGRSQLATKSESGLTLWYRRHLCAGGLTCINSRERFDMDDVPVWAW